MKACNESSDASNPIRDTSPKTTHSVQSSVSISVEALKPLGRGWRAGSLRKEPDSADGD